MKQNKIFDITVKTHHQFENLLQEELKQLGVEDIQVHTRALSFKGDKELLYKANLNSRFALRFLIPIYSFKAKNETQLYNGIRQVNWGEYLETRKTLAIDSAVYSNYFKNSKYVFLKCKDAVVDQFRDKTGVRPSVDLDDPSLRINIHIYEDQVTVSLDSSGSSLHKRGYRLDVNEAPLNEVFAAGLIKLTGWDHQENFVNPMCGSGTLMIEAAMQAYNIPAGIYRKSFGFMKWKDFDSELWRKVQKQSIMQQKSFSGLIFGSDISPDAVRMRRTNLRHSNFDNKVHLERKDFFRQEAPEGKGIVILNPPYGERMELDDIQAFYKRIGDQLKQKFANYNAFIITSAKEGTKSIGLRADNKSTFMAGPLEIFFNKYSLYEGLG